MHPSWNIRIEVFVIVVVVGVDDVVFAVVELVCVVVVFVVAVDDVVFVVVEIVCVVVVFVVAGAGAVVDENADVYHIYVATKLS